MPIPGQRLLNPLSAATPTVSPTSEFGGPNLQAMIKQFSQPQPIPFPDLPTIPNRAFMPRLSREEGMAFRQRALERIPFQQGGGYRGGF